MINKELDDLEKEKIELIEKYGLDVNLFYVHDFLEDDDVTNIDELDKILDYLKSHNIDLNSEFASNVMLEAYDYPDDIIFKVDYVLKHRDELSEDDAEVVIFCNVVNLEKKLSIFRKYRNIFDLSPVEGFGKLILESKLDDIDDRIDFIYESGIADEYGEFDGLKERILLYDGDDYKEKFIPHENNYDDDLGPKL